MNLALCLNGKNGKRYDGESETFVAGTLQSHSARHGHAMSTQQAAESGQLIAATLNSGGNNGGFRTEPGEHLVPIAYRIHAEYSSAMTGNGVARVADEVDVARNLDTCGGYSANQGGNVIATQTVAYQQHGSDVGRMGTLRSGNGDVQSGVPFVFQSRFADNGRGQPDDVAYAVTDCGSGGQTDRRPQCVDTAMRVRRLMPVECERLQGFPDDWTRYGHDGREISDSARYRMIGNSVAVPCVEWIARRIVASGV